MGRIKKGVLGGFSGIVGPVIGASWKGREYMRSLPKKRTKPMTEKQRIQQAKFRVATDFVGTFDGLMKFSYKINLATMPSRNSALGFTLRNVIAGQYPAFEIDCTRALLSEGMLSNVATPSVLADANGKINFLWSDNSGKPKALAGDRVLLAVYCPELKLGSSSIAVAPRTAGRATFDAEEFVGKSVHTWIMVMSADGSDISDSIYTGEVRLADDEVAVAA